MSEHSARDWLIGSTPKQQEQTRRLAHQPVRSGVTLALFFGLSWGAFFWLVNDVSVVVAAVSAVLAGVLFATGMILWARWSVRRSDRLGG